MAFRYSVILTTLAMIGADVWDNPSEVLELIAAAGYDGVDVDAEPDRIDPQRFEIMRETAASVGLRIAGLVGAWGGWHAGEERDLASTDDVARAHAVSYAKKCVDLSADVGGPVFEICAAPLHPEYPTSSIPIDVVRGNFVKSAREIAEYAADRHVPVAIEPINRFEGYAGFLNCVVDAMGVVEEVDLESLGVMVDFFHANIEDPSLCSALRIADSRLMHIHLCDSNRQAPGTGHIDFTEVLRALSAIGYSAWMSLDCVPPRPDLKTFLTRSIGYMKEIERSFELQNTIYGSGWYQVDGRMYGSLMR